MLVIPITSIGFIAYEQLNESLIISSKQKTQSLLNELRLDLKSFEKTTESNLRLFSNDALLHKYVVSDEEYRYNLLLPAILKLFGSYQKAYPEYYEIRVLMPDGFEDARKTNRDILNLTEDEFDSSVFKKMLSKDTSATSFFSINPDNNEFSYYSNFPLIINHKGLDSLNTEPKLRAFLSLTVSLDWLSEKINNFRDKNHTTLYLTDSQANILLHNQKSEPGTNALKHIFQSKTSSLYIDKILNNAPVNQKKILTLESAKGYLWSLPVSENLYLFAWYPNNEITKHSNKLSLNITLISLISVIILSYSIFLLFNRLIIKPISELERFSKNLGKDNLFGTIEIKSKDEIGSLAETFNTMSQNLLHSTEQIKYLAYHDDLTGLPNRLMFMEYTNKAIAQAKRQDCKLSVLYLDLDDFKRVNDIMGHKSGDILLKEVSDRIHNCLRESDFAARKNQDTSNMAARIGGDEFLILLHAVSDNFLPGKIAKRIIDELSKPFILSNNQFHIGVSIGITVYPDDSTTAENLIKHADLAMYHAKSNGKNNYQYYLESMNENMRKRIQIENKLRDAINNKQLHLNYQPQIDRLTGELYGVEALIRWDDPEEGSIPPSIFIPIAEETGLIVELGECILKQACKQVRQWQLSNNHLITVSVNVSALQINKQNLPALISKTLQETGLDARYLDIEITESLIMDDMDRVISILNEIRALGCAISLDDFGTGYSSLNYLRHFPIDILKIDRSFVSEIHNDSDNKNAIIIAIIAMSHALGLKVIAEGIETQYQYEQMIKWQCDYLQGFYLNHPLGIDDMNNLLKNQNTST